MSKRMSLEFADGLNYSYDAANNISETFADNFSSGGVDTRYTYDGLNRMATAVAISDVGAVGNITTSYTYDAVGDLATVTYGNGVKPDRNPATVGASFVPVSR